MTINTTLYVKENGQNVPICPHTTAEHVTLANGQTVEAVLAEDAVAVFEKALIGGNKYAG